MSGQDGANDVQDLKAGCNSKLQIRKNINLKKQTRVNSKGEKIRQWREMEKIETVEVLKQQNWLKDKREHSGTQVRTIKARTDS